MSFLNLYADLKSIPCIFEFGNESVKRNRRLHAKKEIKYKSLLFPQLFSKFFAADKSGKAVLRKIDYFFTFTDKNRVGFSNPSHDAHNAVPNIFYVML